jgi:hypothetical protein
MTIVHAKERTIIQLATDYPMAATAFNMGTNVMHNTLQLRLSERHLKYSLALQSRTSILEMGELFIIVRRRAVWMLRYVHTKHLMDRINFHETFFNRPPTKVIPWCMGSLSLDSH